MSALSGRPVHVAWSREAELANNYFQPAFSHSIRAGAARDGKILYWEHDFVSSPIIMGPLAGGMAWVMDQVTADEGTARGSRPPYELPNRRIRYSDIRTGVPTGAWRGLGAAPNAFAIKSAMDELARAAEIDPLDFRLLNLPAAQHRLAAVLRRVAAICNWSQSSPPNTGRGLACAVYKDQTAVAVVIEVELDHQAKKIKATRAWCAQDCGLVINPGQVENQVLGNIAWGCSMALKERISLEDGAIAETNFHSYQLLRNHECPETVVALVNPDGGAPAGVGEVAMVPVAAAVANAVFSASGRRARRLPIHYDAVFPEGEN